MEILLYIARKKYAVNLNDRAFTLIETLFAFSIFMVMIFFISPIFQLMLNNRDIKERLQVMEWEVFCSQIKKEIRMSQNVEVIAGNLILSKDNETIIYEKYKNVLRRRVDNSGHEVLLQNVSNVVFKRLDHAVKVSVNSVSGETYTITIYASIDWNISA